MAKILSCRVSTYLKPKMSFARLEEAALKFVGSTRESARAVEMWKSRAVCEIPKGRLEPCGFATVSLDARGKRKRKYKREDYATHHQSPPAVKKSGAT